MTLCKFFAHGSCRNGTSCNFIHERNTNTHNHFLPVALVIPAIERLAINPYKTFLDPYLGQQDEGPPQAPSDSRARVLCKFLSRPGGCQRSSCLFFHSRDGHEVEEISSQGFELNEDVASSHFTDYEEFSINTINRTKSVTTILLGVFRGHQYTSTNSATLSESPSPQTTLLHVLQALRQEPLLKQSSISFVA
jgi:hypothetical protein